MNPVDYDGLYIPGERSPEHIRLNEHIPSVVGHLFEADKLVASVCHGGMVLTMVPNHIKDREKTTYIACELEVQAVGSTYIEEALHEDGNFVSGHVWSDLSGLMKIVSNN